MTTAEDLTPGSARCPGAPSLQELLDQERNPVPAPLRDTSYVYLGSEDIPADRYFSREWHDLEVERVWKKAWQVACREEDIPDAGDHVVYDVVDDSLIVTRQPDGSVRAFHNSCLHRGTTLRAESGSVRRFRCPFHGFTWDLDGALVEVPNAWDFPHVMAEKERFSLPEAKVASWGGFVFVNLDPEAAPLEQHLEVLPDHFAHWKLETRWKQFHAVKVVPCNWKVAVEAFIESFHVIDTHPQILDCTADANTQYDVWPGVANVNRMINAFGVPSPHVMDQVDDQAVAEAALALFGRRVIGTDPIEVPEGMTPRMVVADRVREGMTKATGVDHSGITDCEALDAIQYFVFPNFAPWAGPTQSLVYRWRPNGNDPDTCLMDVMRLVPLPEGMPRPPGAPVQHLTLEQSWKEAEGMGGLADVFEQDMANLPRVQKGLKAARKGVTLADYEEIRIRHLHQTLERWLGVREG